MGTVVRVRQRRNRCPLFKQTANGRPRVQLCALSYPLLLEGASASPVLLCCMESEEGSEGLLSRTQPIAKLAAQLWAAQSCAERWLFIAACWLKM